MKKVIITQSNYIPWKGYFDAINQVDELILYDDMQYTKRDWRNRNKIKTKDGVIWLSIPVEVKGNYFQKINETRIADKSWAETHWKTIFHNYSKAPYFKTFKDEFEKAYSECTFSLLSEVNFHFITLICRLLKITTPIRWSSEFNLAEGKTERLVDIVKQTQGTDYYSGKAASAYMDESLFKQTNIVLHYLDTSGYPEYPQIHGDFVHEVSILDLLFNQGHDAKKFMKSFKHG